MDSKEETEEITVTTSVSRKTQAIRTSSTLVNSSMDATAPLKEELFVFPSSDEIIQGADASFHSAQSTLPPIDEPSAGSATDPPEEPKKRLLPRVVGSLRSWIYPNGQAQEGNLEDLETVDIDDVPSLERFSNPDLKEIMASEAVLQTETQDSIDEVEKEIEDELRALSSVIRSNGSSTSSLATATATASMKQEHWSSQETILQHHSETRSSSSTSTKVMESVTSSSSRLATATVTTKDKMETIVESIEDSPQRVLMPSASAKSTPTRLSTFPALEEENPVRTRAPSESSSAKSSPPPMFLDLPRESWATVSAPMISKSSSLRGAAAATPSVTSESSRMPGEFPSFEVVTEEQDEVTFNESDLSIEMNAMSMAPAVQSTSHLESSTMHLSHMESSKMTSSTSRTVTSTTKTAIHEQETLRRSNSLLLSTTPTISFKPTNVAVASSDVSDTSHMVYNHHTEDTSISELEWYKARLQKTQDRLELEKRTSGFYRSDLLALREQVNDLNESLHLLDEIRVTLDEVEEENEVLRAQVETLNKSLLDREVTVVKNTSLGRDIDFKSILIRESYETHELHIQRIVKTFHAASEKIVKKDVKVIDTQTDAIVKPAQVTSDTQTRVQVDSADTQTDSTDVVSHACQTLAEKKPELNDMGVQSVVKMHEGGSQVGSSAWSFTDSAIQTHIRVKQKHMQTQAEAVVSKAEFNCQVGYTADVAVGSTQTKARKSHSTNCQTDPEIRPTVHSFHTQTKSHKLIGLGIQTELIPGPEMVSSETGMDLVMIDGFAQTRPTKCVEGGVQTTPVLVMFPHEYPSPPVTTDSFTSMPVVEHAESFMQTKLHAHDVLIRQKTSEGFAQTDVHPTKEKPSQTEHGKVKGKVVQTDEYIPPTPPREEVSLQTDVWKGLDGFSQTVVPKLKHFAINTERMPISGRFIQTDSHPLDDASSQTTLVEHKEFATQSVTSSPSFSESGDQTDDELMMSVPYVIAALSKRDAQQHQLKSLSEEVTETMTTQTVHVKKKGGKKSYARAVSPLQPDSISSGTQYEPAKLHGSSTQTDAAESTPDAFERIAKLQSQILVIQREKDTLSQQVVYYKSLDVPKTPAACQTDLTSDGIRDKEAAVAASLMETSAQLQTLEHEMGNLRTLNTTLVHEIHSVKNRPKTETLESGLQTDAYESDEAKQVFILPKQLETIRIENSTLVEKINVIQAKSAAAKSVSDHEAQTDLIAATETAAVSLQTDEDKDLSYKIYVLEQELTILRIENTTLVSQLNVMTENHGILEKQLERKVAESLVKKDVASLGLQTETDAKNIVEVSLQTDPDDRLASMEQELHAMPTRDTELSDTLQMEKGRSLMETTVTVTTVETVTPNISKDIKDTDEIALLRQELFTLQEEHSKLQAEYEIEKNRTVVETTTTTTTESIDERILTHIQSLEQQVMTLKDENGKLREEIDSRFKNDVMATSNDTRAVVVANGKTGGSESHLYKITEEITETRTTVEKNGGAVGYNYNAELAARNELLVAELIDLRRKYSLLDTQLKSHAVSTSSTQIMRSDSSILRESDINILRSELIQTRNKYVATLEELNKVRRENINMIEQPLKASSRELPAVPKELYMRLEELEKVNGELQARLKSLPSSSASSPLREKGHADPQIDALLSETQELKEELERQSGLTELYRQKLVETSIDRDELKVQVAADRLGSSSSGVPADIRRHRSIPSLNRDGELQFNMDTRLSQQAEELSLMELELAKQQQKVQHLESLLRQSQSQGSSSQSRSIQPVSPFEYEQQQQSLAPFEVENNLIFSSHLQPHVKPDTRNKGWTYIDKRISVRLLQRMKKPATKDA